MKMFLVHLGKRSVLKTAILAVALAITVVPASAHCLTGSFSGYYRVFGSSYQYFDVPLIPGQPTVIQVDGDGGTDLDVEVFDPYGNLIGWDYGWGWHSEVVVFARCRGFYRIVVTNNGRFANDYALFVS